MAPTGTLDGASDCAPATVCHPNPFESEELSDDARRLTRDLKAVFGPTRFEVEYRPNHRDPRLARRLAAC